MNVPHELNEKYEFLKKLGQGGMGQVFQARCRTTSKLFAIKLLFEKLGKDENQQKRFLREASLAKQEIHEAIVRALHCGVADGISYIVYEYVDGETLAEILGKRRPLSVSETVTYLRSLASALAALHREGVVHRDVKPSNIIIEKNGNLRLLDLGIARFLESGHSITETGMIIGTPHFLAPELISGKKVLPSADIYAVGALAIDCLSPISPFKDWKGQVVNKLNERAAGLGRLAIPSSASGDLAELLRRATSFDCAMRYKDGETLSLALEKLSVQGGAVTEVSTLTEEVTKSALAPALAERTPIEKPKSNSSKFLIVAVVLFFAVLMVSHPFTKDVDTTVTNLQISEGVDFVEVRWSSREGYSGIVELVPDGEKSLRAIEGSAGTSHVVLVERVPPNKPGRLTILFPSGQRSLSHKYSSRDRALTLLDCTRVANSIHLQFASSPKGVSALLKLADGSQITGKRRGEKWLLDVPRVLNGSNLVGADIVVRGRGGLEHTFSLQECLRKQVLRASDGLHETIGRQLFNDALMDSKKKSRDFEKPLLGTEALMKWRRERASHWFAIAKRTFKENGDEKRLDIIAGLSPLSFSSLLSLSEQSSIIQKLLYFRKLKSLLFKFSQAPLFNEPFTGHFHFSSQPQGENAFTLRLTTEKAVKLMEGLDSRSVAMPLWSEHFDLSNGDIGSCELKFTIGRWRGPWLALKVNENKLVIPSPRLISGWRRIRTDRSSELKVVYQRIPPSYLVKGKNVIELRIDSVERLGSVVALEKIELLLYYK